MSTRQNDRLKSKIFRIELILLLLVVSLSHSIMMTSNRMAYVDIEKVFNEIQEVRKAKEKLKYLIEEKKQIIGETERAIATVRNKISKAVPSQEISASTETIPSSEISASTETIPSSEISASTEAVPSRMQQATGRLPDFEMEEFKKILDDKEKELKKLMEKSKQLIQGKEKEIKYKILGQIYETIQDIAMDRGYTVIVDKEIILFSEETVEDVTDEVIRSLNEKYR